MIPPARADEVSNYQAVDTMMDFGTKQIANMEAAWLTAVHDEAATKPGDLDLQRTMMMLRPDVRFKRSRL